MELLRSPLEQRQEPPGCSPQLSPLPSLSSFITLNCSYLISSAYSKRIMTFMVYLFSVNNTIWL